MSPSVTPENAFQVLPLADRAGDLVEQPKPAELLVHALFGAPALGGVPDRGDRLHPPRRFERGEADVGGKFAAVLAPREQLAPVAHRANARRGEIAA